MALTRVRLFTTAEDDTSLCDEDAAVEAAAAFARACSPDTQLLLPSSAPAPNLTRRHYETDQ